jgi:hypothetical protein
MSIASRAPEAMNELSTLSLSISPRMPVVACRWCRWVAKIRLAANSQVLRQWAEVARLEHQPLEKIAHREDEVAVLRMRRHRAEARLLAALTQGYLSGLVSADTRTESARQAMRRRAARTGATAPTAA